MPTISLRTVYQTLNDLASMGELVQLELGTGSARFDPNLDAHHHLVCDQCGKVLDVEVDASTVQVPSAGRRGFNIESTEIVFRGVCADCSHLHRSHRSNPSNPSNQRTKRNQHA